MDVYILSRSHWLLKAERPSIDRVVKSRAALQLLNRRTFRQHTAGVGIPHGDDLIPGP